MPRSQVERVWMIAGGLVAFLMVLIGYVFFISPQRDQTSSVDSQVQSVQAANDALQAKLTALATQNRNLAQFKTAAAKARLALPDASELAVFLRTLQSIGSSTHTNVTSLAATSPVDVTAIATATQTTVAPTASTNDAATTDSTQPAAKRPVVQQPLVHVYALPVTLTVTGAVPALDAFLTQLQSVQPRAVLVSQVSESVAGVKGSRTIAVRGTAPTVITITMYAFVSPGSAAEAAQLRSAQLNGAATK